MRIKLAIACLIFASCAPTPRVAVSDDFSPRELHEIRQATRKWNTILVNPMAVDGPGAPWKLVKADPPGRATSGFTGLTNHDTNTVYLSPDVDPEFFYPMVLHELGHVNGLKHIAGEGVMNPSVKKTATEFTEADLEECRAVGACSLAAVDQEKCRLQGACE